MAVIYHNGEESIKKYKGKVLVRFVGGQFWKTITREVDFRSIFFSIWKERSLRFFDLYLMKMKRKFEPYIHFTLRRMLWEDVHYTRGQEYCSVFAAVWEPFEWIKAGYFGRIFLDKIDVLDVCNALRHLG